MSEKGPVFVAGAERSGTSLLYALLTSHPQIAMMRRTNYWAYFHHQFGDLSQPKNFERCLQAMMRYKRIHVWQPDPERLRQEFAQGEPSYGRLLTILARQYAQKKGKPRWGDKSLNTERYADAVFATFPEARLIHIIRDPRDRYASALKRWQVIRGEAGSGTAAWLASAHLAWRNERRFAGRYMVVRYETLVAQPEATLRDICRFLDEPYTPAMIAMHGAAEFRDEGGNSSYGTRQPGQISTNSVGRYRQMLSPQAIAFIQQAARRQMLAFGYELEPMHWSARERLRFALVDWPLNMVRMWAWHARETYYDVTGRVLPDRRIVDEPLLVPQEGTPS